MVQQTHNQSSGQNDLSDLGTLRATYYHTMLSKTILTLIICFVVLALLLFGSRFLSLPLLTLTLGGIFSLIFLIVFISCLVLFLRYRYITVRVYEHGLVATNREGWTAMRWREVEYVWHKVDLQTPDPNFEIDTNRLAYIAYDHPHSASWSNLDYVTHTEASKGSSILKHAYVLRSYSGLSINIPYHFMRWTRLCDTIDEETARCQFPAARSLFQQGKPVSFGPLLLHRDGMYYGQDLLPWHLFGGFSVDEHWGLITITVRGYARPWAWLLLARVPNVALLKGMLATIRDTLGRMRLS